MSIDIDQRVDVVVSLGSPPITTASFDSAMFLADLTDVEFPDDYRVYTKLTEIAVDFLETTPTYKYAALVFGGNFNASKVYVVKYRSAGSILTPAQAFNQFMLTNQEPRYISCDSREEVNLLALAAAVNAADRIHVHATQSPDVVVPSAVADIASLLQDAAYDTTITLYSKAADSNFAEGGIVGAMAAIQAGVSTLEDKTLVGVVSDNLTATERLACEQKNVAYYSPIAGVNSVFNSKVASGQFLDTILFTQWLKARIGEALYGTIKRESEAGRKVSFDGAGGAKLRSSIYNNVINIGLANGSISRDIEPIVRTPTREEVSEADRAGRILNGVVVEVLYSNAVHKVNVRAYVNI